tara:strand:- start:146 stop:442 length:297 start_codon:yes stop_codon:yes gene_type:complete
MTNRTIKLKYEYIFDRIIAKVIHEEGYHLDEWDLPCKGDDNERRRYWVNNQKECIEHFYTFNGLHSDNWGSEQHMLNDIGYNPLYMDVIECVEGTRLK